MYVCMYVAAQFNDLLFHISPDPGAERKRRVQGSAGNDVVGTVSSSHCKSHSNCYPVLNSVVTVPGKHCLVIHQQLHKRNTKLQVMILDHRR